MSKKENRPDACTASGTASTIYDDYIASVSAGQGRIDEAVTESVWDDGLCLPDCCSDDIVGYCEGQAIAYDDLIEYAVLFCLQNVDADMVSRDDLKYELLTLTNRCVDAYNMGRRDENAPVGAKLSEAYPDQKKGSNRYKHLTGLHPMQIAVLLLKLHHAAGIFCDDDGIDGNYNIGVYQASGPDEGCYDTTDEGLTRLIRLYNKAISMRDVEETKAVLRSICKQKSVCMDENLVTVNNGIYDYKNKLLMDFDPELVFLTKSRVDFVDHAPNPVIHNDEDGMDWDVVSWMNKSYRGSSGDRMCMPEQLGDSYRGYVRAVSAVSGTDAEDVDFEE